MLVAALYERRCQWTAPSTSSLETEHLNLATHTWLSKLTDLNQDRSRGTAPHKPLLHLVVLDLFESGKLASGEFRRDGELAFRFNSYWSLGAVGRGSRPDVKLPFFHSRSDGFWTPFKEDGRPAAARELARIARLDPGYLLCLADPGFRTALAALFSIDLAADSEELPLPAPLAPEATRKRDTRSKTVALHRRGSTPKRCERNPQDQSPSGFTLASIFHRSLACSLGERALPALTGYRMVAEDGTTILDAAHIHSFSQGGPCTVRNGLALTHRVGAAFTRQSRGAKPFTRQSRGATALYRANRVGPQPFTAPIAWGHSPLRDSPTTSTSSSNNRPSTKAATSTCCSSRRTETASASRRSRASNPIRNISPGTGNGTDSDREKTRHVCQMQVS
jgi:putative restriction endonuclease